MGDVGIDKWCWKMGDHRKKGHYIIEYGETADRKIVNETGPFLKDQRDFFWEKHHNILTTNDLIWWEREVET